MTNAMIPFPFLRYNDKEKHKFVCVLVRQIGKPNAYKRGYYRMENDILIGKNGQISIEEFMKEMARAWKSKEISSEHGVHLLEVFGIFKLGVRGNKIMIASSAREVYLFKFYPLSIESFLNKEDFFRTVPRLLFDKERYLAFEYL